MDGLLINLKFYTLKSKTIQLFYGADKFLLWNLSVFQKYREANRDGKAVKRGI